MARASLFCQDAKTAPVLLTRIGELPSPFILNIFEGSRRVRGSGRVRGALLNA